MDFFLSIFKNLPNLMFLLFTVKSKFELTKVYILEELIYNDFGGIAALFSIKEPALNAHKYRPIPVDYLHV